jgi:transposase
MDNTNFQLLLELLERESSARIASEEARVAENSARAAENSAFQQTIEDLNTTIKQLNDTIGLLLEENRLLKGPKKNSSNSSVPPSKDPNRPKRTNSLRKSSGKSSGGQTGHDGSTLQMCSTPDVLIDHRPDFCNCCGLDLVDQPGQLTSRRQVIDIPPIAPLYTEHRVFQKKCTCGHKTSSTFPNGVAAPISYGPQTSAVIAYLHTRQFVPLARISEFFTSVCNMPISQGTICGILDRLAEKARPAFELIKQAVCKSSVVGSDETGVNLNGKLHWIWTWQSQKATYITFSSSRGKQTIQDNFPEGFHNSILVSDCLASQLATQARGHQICTAHLLRELLFFQEKYQSNWADRFRAMLLTSLQLKKNIPIDAYDKHIKERADLESILESLLNERIDPGHIEVVTFQKRIIKLRDYLFTFLYHKEVPAENNASERAIRNVKVKQKVSGMFKAKTGVRNYTIFRSIADTCIKNTQCILNAYYTVATI